ncbi:MAG: cystathionine beta-lyase, partial [Actinomycetota bacterium]
QEIYEAMLTGPQNMPVFADTTLQVEDKQAIIAYITDLQNSDSPGGLALGRLGPVTEGLFLWAGVFAAFIGLAVWIGIRAR